MPCYTPCGKVKDGQICMVTHTPYSDGVCQFKPPVTSEDFMFVERARRHELEELVQQYNGSKSPENLPPPHVLLCSACRVLDRLGYDFDENPSLSRWWEIHKRDDDRRSSNQLQAMVGKAVQLCRSMETDTCTCGGCDSCATKAFAQNMRAVLGHGE